MKYLYPTTALLSGVYMDVIGKTVDGASLIFLSIASVAFFVLMDWGDV